MRDLEHRHSANITGTIVSGSWAKNSEEKQDIGIASSLSPKIYINYPGEVVKKWRFWMYFYTRASQKHSPCIPLPSLFSYKGLAYLLTSG